MLTNRARSAILYGATLPGGMPRALVHVCINSYGNYKECLIVGVRPDINVAVLKVLKGEVDDDNNGDKNKDNGRE